MTRSGDYLQNAPALLAARAHSLEVVASLRDALARAAAPPQLATVVAAGSLSRLELGHGSDLDAIIVAEPGTASAALETMAAAVYDQLAPAGLALPKADGIYRRALTTTALLSPAARGSLDEDAAVFGKRMQFLLDVRALHAPHRAQALREEILAWYAAGAHQAGNARASQQPWHFLLQDLGRYRHAYAVWQQHKLSRSETDSWQLRQIKLHSSRLLTFSGLALVLGESLVQPNAVAWVAARLDLTPLERIAGVMQRYDPAAFERLLRNYDLIHARLAQPGVREELVATGPDADGDHDTCASFRELAAQCADIRNTLTAFMLDRRKHWPTAYFATLLL